jgi:ABC-type cobalt transport system substrate-binding protein
MVVILKVLAYFGIAIIFYLLGYHEGKKQGAEEEE